MKTLIISIFFLMIFSLNCNANVSVITGKIGNTQYTVTYNLSGKNIVVTNEKEFKFKLSGYAVDNIFVKDLNSDGNDEIIYLDLSGISVGGNLNIIFWNGNTFKKITTDKYSNKISLLEDNNKIYILLMQHDTDDLYFVSDLYVFKNFKILESKSNSAINKLIKEYEEKANTSKEDWIKSRYYSYISILYKKVFNNKQVIKYQEKARLYDENNPFLK